MPCYLCLFWGLYKQLCSVLARGRGQHQRSCLPLRRLLLPLPAVAAGLSAEGCWWGGLPPPALLKK